MIWRHSSRCSVGVLTCKANFLFLDCIRWRQPWELEILSNFYTSREFIVSISSLATSAWKQQEHWEWRGGEDTWLKVLHVLQFACPERFAHGGVSPWIRSTSVSFKWKRNSRNTGCPTSESRVFHACIQLYLGRLGPLNSVHTWGFWTSRFTSNPSVQCRMDCKGVKSGWLIGL